MNKPITPVVIIGCGYVGRQVAKHYRQKARPVSALVRSTASAETLSSLNIQALAADLATDINLPFAIRDADLFHFAPPPAKGSEDYHTTHLINAMSNAEAIPRRIVYISTTGVYGDCHGRWIDENEPLKPEVDRAKRRFSAEQQLQAFSRKYAVELVILRVAGIYGPGKLPIKRLKQNLPVIKREEAPFTNRIHAEDLVRIAIAAMERAVPGSIYNVSDGSPSTMTEYFNAVADKAGLDRPTQISLVEGEQQLSAGMMSYMRESRRLANNKLIEELDLELLYPDLAAGIEHCGI